MLPRVVPSALLALALASVAAIPARAADYVQAPGSALAFASRYDGEVFTGRFQDFATRFSFDPARLSEARLEVTIALLSARTGNADRDSTLVGVDFFDVGRHAQARYNATKFRALGGDRYAADGTLSLRGISKPVTLEFTWTPGAQPTLVGKATVKRLDFNVGAGDWSDTGLMPNDVAVSTRVLFRPAGPAAGSR